MAGATRGRCLGLLLIAALFMASSDSEAGRRKTGAKMSGGMSFETRREIVFNTPTDRLVVPKKGAAASPEAVDLARQILEFDRLLSAECDCYLAADCPCAVENPGGFELRSAALGELRRGLETMTLTSSGSFPPWVRSIMKRLFDSWSAATSDLRTRAKTRIEGALTEDHVIEYVESGDPPPSCRSKQDGWRSYTSGQEMRTGLYQFRVTRDDRPDFPCCEPVPVFDDPTAHMICARLRGARAGGAR